MLINNDFTQRAIVHGQQIEWIASPMAGVDRRMFDRIGDEVARATSIVRYAPDSHFSPHVHDGGEEFVVLDGVFQDEHGDYPAGTYVRNPPTSRHTPGSAAGCTIFVKLHQFDPADRTFTRLDTNHVLAIPLAEHPGVQVVPLYHDDRETVNLERLDSGITTTFGDPDGCELLVLGGDVLVAGEQMTEQSWMRLPPHDEVSATAGDSGAAIWIKRRHLRGAVLKTGAFAKEDFGL